MTTQMTAETLTITRVRIPVDEELMGAIDMSAYLPTKTVKHSHRKSNQAWAQIKKYSRNGLIYLDFDGDTWDPKYVSEPDKINEDKYRVLDLGPAPTLKLTKQATDRIFQKWDNEL